MQLNKTPPLFPAIISIFGYVTLVFDFAENVGNFIPAP